MKGIVGRLLSKKRLVIVLVATIALLGSAFGYWRLNHGEGKADYLTGQVERGDIIKAISATGTTQALMTVQVGSQVSGTIAALNADFNSVVKKGQVVAKLDPAIFQAQLEQAQANLSNAEASVRAADSAVTSAEANLLAAQANEERARVAMQDAQRFLTRNLELQKSAVVSQRDVESAQANADQTAAQYRQAKAQVEQAKAQLLSTKSQRNQASAQVEQARAAVQLASVNLSHTIITAPIDGVVVARNVDVGQTVAASLQAPTLFLIANDLTKMRVLADIDEADVGQLGPQSQVTFTVDAYPRDVFRGRISQVRLNPQTVQNVVTYTAVIDVDNPELKLKPGMTANVTVTVAERRNILKIPNGALRFKPELSEEQRKEVAALMGGSGHTGQPGPGPAPGVGSNDVSNGSNNGGLRPHRPTGWAGAPPSPSQRPDPRSGNALASGKISGWSPVTGERPRVQVVWTLGANNQVRPVRVKLGITDGTSSELIEGQLKEGDAIITGQTGGSEANATQRPNSPFGGPFGASPRRR